ncbi:MAG: ribonuclease III [Propionibacteriaceae bacterium]|jgi:ribonuclease-3|nr:ribonuclease III [Propionibacteriaceae bacterium]
MSRVRDLLNDLGVEVDAPLYQLALTHSSYAYENGRVPDNERLEFLGDAVLEVVVTDYLYRSFPDYPEGKLAKLRAAVVNTQSLARIGKSLDLGRELLLGKGELTTGGSQKNSLLANAVEAIIGAVYLSAGSDGAGTFVRQLFNPVIAEAAQRGAGSDWKTSLQELSAQNDLGSPEYVITDFGPDHRKEFTATVHVGNYVSPAGRGTSKKFAEQEAARTAVAQLSERLAVSAAEQAQAQAGRQVLKTAETPAQD